MEILNFISANSNALTTICAIIATCLAVYGLREWKRQLKGRTDYEIARRYLRASLKVRDAIKYVRNPFIPIGEMQTALKEHGFNVDEYNNNQKTNRAVYSIRWKKVSDALTELEAELLEAEVSWGKDAVIAQEQLDSCVRRLLVAITMFLRGLGDEKQDKIIYLGGEQDEFGIEVSSAVEKIKLFLKPHLD